MDRPVCAKCGKVMTPEDSKIHPEYFLHDACLPEELKPKESKESVDTFDYLIDGVDEGYKL